MDYKALITFDLPDANAEQRSAFYAILRDKKWTKIESLTTAWKAFFKDDVERIDAIKMLKQDLLKAKIDSKIRKVEYAIQLDKFDIVVSNL